MCNVSLQVSLGGQLLILKWAENQASEKWGFFEEKNIEKGFFEFDVHQLSRIKRTEIIRKSAQIWAFLANLMLQSFYVLLKISRI